VIWRGWESLATLPTPSAAPATLQHAHRPATVLTTPPDSTRMHPRDFSVKYTGTAAAAVVVVVVAPPIPQISPVSPATATPHTSPSTAPPRAGPSTQVLGGVMAEVPLPARVLVVALVTEAMSRMREFPPSAMMMPPSPRTATPAPVPNRAAVPTPFAAPELKDPARVESTPPLPLRFSTRTR
jgi:hypothetical protein